VKTGLAPIQASAGSADQVQSKAMVELDRHQDLIFIRFLGQGVERGEVPGEIVEGRCASGSGSR
jgi:hypothetical protein